MQSSVFPFGDDMVGGAFYGGAEEIEINGFFDIIVGAFAEGLFAAIDGAMGGDEHDFADSVAAGDVGQDTKAVNFTAEFEIGYDDVGIDRLEFLQGLFAIVGGGDAVSFPFESFAQGGGVG